MPFCAKWGSRIYGTVFDRARFVMKTSVTHQGVLAGVHWLELSKILRQGGKLAFRQTATHACYRIFQIPHLSIYAVL